VKVIMKPFNIYVPVGRRVPYGLVRCGQTMHPIDPAWQPCWNIVGSHTASILQPRNSEQSTLKQSERLQLQHYPHTCSLVKMFSSIRTTITHPHRVMEHEQLSMPSFPRSYIALEDQIHSTIRRHRSSSCFLFMG
jgi:hypothetical protein